MCALNDKILIPKYDCRCEIMHEARITFGLWMIDELTLMITDGKSIKI